MAKKPKHKKGAMEGKQGQGGSGDIKTAEKETPEEVKPFLAKAIKIEA